MTAKAPPHIDDLPAVEYESGRLVERDKYWYLNFAMLARNMTPLGRGFSGIENTVALERAERERRRRTLAHLAFLENRLGIGNRAP